VSASGISPASTEVFVAEALSLSRSPDAPQPWEKFRLEARNLGEGVTSLVVVGIGSDVESASQNAAELALKNVLGSFVQSDKEFSKRSEILEGIRLETKTLRSSVREYSQGSIAEFELKSAEKVDDYFKVTARVVVRKSDFQGFVRRVVEGQGKIDSSLFSEISTDLSQKNDLHNIIHDTILKPVNKGQVLDITVGKPIPYSKSLLASALGRVESRQNDFEWQTKRSRLITKLKQGLGFGWQTNSIADHLVVFPVRVQLREDYKWNMNETLQSVATRLNERPKQRLQKQSVLNYYVLPKTPFGSAHTARYAKQAAWVIPVGVLFTLKDIATPQVTIFGDRDTVVYERSADSYYGKARSRTSSAFVSINSQFESPVDGSLLSESMGEIGIFSVAEFYFVVSLTEDQVRNSRRIEFKYATPQ
jgi:hypothetical protein